MYFVHITTLSDADDFVSWLDGKNRLSFNDSQDFDEWLDGQRIFPLEIYINGMTIRFTNKTQVEYFRLGIEVILNVKMREKDV